MLNKITEPQALYSKAPTPGSTVHSSLTTPPSKKKFNWKVVSGIVTVSLVAIVGVAGVLIAQRQQSNQSPVAPNAPESRPQAAIPGSNICSLGFEVAGTPAAGAAECISKTATKVVGATKTALAANAKVKPADVIEYTITIGTKTDTTRVDIRDTFPTASLDYVAGSAKLDGVAVTVNADEINKNILVVGYDVAQANRGKQNKLTYQVKVKTTAANNTQFTNNATIKFNNIATATDSCEMNLAVEVATPATGVASCIEKKAFKIDGSTEFSRTGVSLAKRGEVITYRIVIQANSRTSGPVVVKDVLPSSVTFKNASVKFNGVAATAAQAQYAAATKTLTFNLGEMATGANNLTNRGIVILYDATVNTNAPISNFKNAVTVSTNGVASTTPAACNVTIGVMPEGVAACTSKLAFTDYSGTPLPKDSVVQKGSTFVYKLTVGASQTTTGAVQIVDTLPSSLEFVESKGNTLQNNNGTLTASIPTFGNTPNNLVKVYEYKVKVKTDAPAGTFTNAVTVTTANGTSSTVDKCSLSLQVPYQCDSTCTTDAQCNNGNDTKFICSSSAGNKCRLASNEGSNSCEGSTPSFSCNSSCQNNAQCQTSDANYVCAPTSDGDRCRHKDYTTRPACDAPPTTATPTPTPAIGCNDSCTSNADCSNPSHICYTTGEGTQLCRLDTNPASNTCSNPTTPGTPTTPIQPTLPEELPQTGPEDWVNWLKAGLITLGVGAALLLLL